VGLSGVVVRLAIFEFTYRFAFRFIETNWRFSVANGTAIFLSIFTNYVLNDIWTWGDRQKGNWHDWRNRLVKYYISAGIAGILDFTTAELVLRFALKPYLGEHQLAEWITVFIPLVSDASTLPDLRSTLAVCTGIGVGMFVNFFAGHLWAFRNDRTIVG
jgi:putative flippase GtrA